MSALDGTPFEALTYLTVKQLQRIDPATVRSVLDPVPVRPSRDELAPCIFGQALRTHHILPAVSTVQRLVGAQAPHKDWERAARAAKFLSEWNDEAPYTPERRAELAAAVSTALAEKGGSL